MSLQPVSRSRLHEVVLALCVLACVANGLRQHEPRRAVPVRPAPAVTESSAAAMDSTPTLDAEIRFATGASRPEAR